MIAVILHILVITAIVIFAPKDEEILLRQEEKELVRLLEPNGEDQINSPNLIFDSETKEPDLK